ncbi:response regulator [Paraburkholderia sp. RL18-101-BIB-B]|uniref:response regulator n=1 Tax=Paraburkholderia sp. RL18-101-BIB-B TaxID=3031634 RepID=UPI0038B6DEFE
MNTKGTTDVLVIEDDPILREAIGEWLQVAGYGVRKAIDGRAGLTAVMLAAPSLNVTDTHMPDLSGAVVIAEIKGIHPTMPIIAISGLFDSREGFDADAAFAIRAARALAKPFKRVDLLCAVGDRMNASA